jgi:hypothetical protein
VTLNSHFKQLIIKEKKKAQKNDQQQEPVSEE